MAFGSIELTTIARSQDYSMIKQNEDNKGALNQMNGYLQVQKNENQKTREVHSSDNADWSNKNPDAREKGHGDYYGDGGKKRKESTVERMVVKGKNSGFDIKI